MLERDIKEDTNLQSEKPEPVKEKLTMSERNVESHTSALFKNGRAIDTLSPEDKWFTAIMMVVGMITLIGYIVAYITKGH
jgi:hypothetical protein